MLGRLANMARHLEGTGFIYCVALVAFMMAMWGCAKVPSATCDDPTQSLSPTPAVTRSQTPGPLQTPSAAPTKRSAVILPTWPAQPSVPDRYAIELAVGTIDTRVGEPPLPDTLRLESYAPKEDGYFIVQFVDVIVPELQNQVDALGVERLGYVPNNALLVRMTPAQRDAVAQLDVVQWIGIYQPAYRISPDLPRHLEGRSVLIVMTFPGVDVARIEAQLRDWGGTIEACSSNEFGGKARVAIDLSCVPQIARLKGIMWIEPWVEPELSTDS